MLNVASVAPETVIKFSDSRGELRESAKADKSSGFPAPAKTGKSAKTDRDFEDYLAESTGQPAKTPESVEQPAEGNVESKDAAITKAAASEGQQPKATQPSNGLPGAAQLTAETAVQVPANGETQQLVVDQFAAAHGEEIAAVPQTTAPDTQAPDAALEVGNPVEESVPVDVTTQHAEFAGANLEATSDTPIAKPDTNDTAKKVTHAAKPAKFDLQDVMQNQTDVTARDDADPVLAEDELLARVQLFQGAFGRFSQTNDAMGPSTDTASALLANTGEPVAAIEDLGSAANDANLDASTEWADMQTLIGPSTEIDGAAQTSEVAPTNETYQSVEAKSVPGQIADSIVTRTKLMSQPGRVEFEMELDPPELGRVHIRLVHADHGVSAKIVVANERTLHLVENQLATLRDSIEQGGTTLTNLDLSQFSFADGQGAWQDAQSDSRPFVGGGWTSLQQAASATRHATIDTTNSSTRRVDLRA